MAGKFSSLFGITEEKKHQSVKKESDGEKSTALMTRDLLGGPSIVSKELDLDMPVPCGWEKFLDLKSGKLYIQRQSSLGSPSGSEPKLQENHPPSSKAPLNHFDGTSLDLKKLVPHSLPSRSNYQSMCTLANVKSALERAKEEKVTKKRASPPPPPPPASFSSSSSSSSITTQEEEQSEENKVLDSPIAAGCPGCLSYLLVTKKNPKCPRCKIDVPIRLMKKKPKFDLNMSIEDNDAN